VLRSSVMRARRLRVRSGLVVIAAWLGCAGSAMFTAGPVGRTRSLGSVWGWVGGLVGEFRPVSVGGCCLESVGVGWYEGALWESRIC
jgi:hypothetical protein